MKTILHATLIASMTAGVAAAADMSSRSYVKAPATTLRDWSGFYVGGDAGAQRSSNTMSDPQVGTRAYDFIHESALLGGFAGYQHQWGQIVLGVEGGYATAFGEGTDLRTPSINIFTPGGAGRANSDLNNVWTVGGRAGLAIGNWLPYVSGGYANGTFDFHANDGRDQRAQSALDGSYIGGGLNWAPIAGGVFRNVVLGVEYRHYEFSSRDTLATGPGLVPETVRFNPKSDAIFGRMSYKFEPTFGKF